MASINKLSLRGIRAFSPDDDEQVITFAYPLTIIVGANGCGKTTIIEALKYAVTGALPPGNKSGQAFVHDPKHNGTPIVKAQVKLRFTNRAGKSMVVVRSMELTQKKTTMTFKNLDGTLRTTDDQGNKQSLSHKCGELDRQIPQLLGVSKAVLSDVVFCHQEESSWPLMEGAVLKKRFDDIFDSTRYVKALEEIKDQKKLYTGKVKDIKADLNLLKGHKHAAGGYRNELDDCKHQLSLIVDERNEFQEKVNGEREKIIVWQDQRKKGDDLQAKIDDISYKIDNETVRIETQKNGLQSDFTETMKREDLENVLKGFGKTMDIDARELRAANERVDEIKSKIKSVQEKQFSSLGEKGQLEGEKRTHDENLQTRIELMEELANKYGLELSTSQTQQTDIMNTQGSHISANDDGVSVFTSATMATSSNIQITDEDLEAFERSVAAKREELKDQLDEHRNRSRGAEDGIQNELTELSGKIKAIESDLDRVVSERERARKAYQKINRTTGSAGRMRESEIKNYKEQAKQCAEMRAQKDKDPRRTEIPEEIKHCNEKVESLKSEIFDLNSSLKDLRKVAEDQSAVNMLQNMLQNEVEAMTEIIGENSSTFHSRNIRVRPDDEHLFGILNEAVGNASDQLDSTTTEFENHSESLRLAESRLSKEAAVLNQNKSTIKSRKNQLETLSADGRGVQRIKQIRMAVQNFERNNLMLDQTIAQNIEPQELLQHFTDKIGELITDNDQPETISRTMKKLKKMSKEKDANGNSIGIICPCCTRPLVQEDEVRVFQAQMNSLADVTESPIIQMDREKAQLNAIATRNYTTWRNSVSSSINDWLDHTRISAEIGTLETSISKGETDIKKLERDLEGATGMANDAKDEITNLQQFLEVVRPLRDDCARIEKKRSDLASKKNNLEFNAPNLGGKDLTKTENDLQRKSEEKDKLQSKITVLNQEQSDLSTAISQLTAKCTNAEEMVRRKEEQFAEQQKALTEKNELNEAIHKCDESEKQLKDQILPIRQKENLKATERNKIRTQSSQEETKRSDILNAFINEFHRFKSVSSQIEKFIKSNKLLDLKSLETVLSSIVKQIMESETELNDLTPEVEEMKAKVQDKEAKQDNIVRNLELLDMIAGQLKLEDEQFLLQDKMNKLDVDSIIGQLNDAKKKVDNYKSEIDRRLGSKDSLEIQQRELKRKLQTSEYKNIDERYRVKMIEHETSNMCVSDLDLYYSALDKALLRYHGVKIQEINKIIQELWAMVYRGEDITSIRLTSDQETSSRASRSYNYRVVMTKGTTELDMRGRCSAGQRVLASIVIRLALAETFCINCGVMALDEPTTNLDYANKRGLATALAQIIAHRAAQDNFQLVIITHDEEFVTMMKHELSSQTGFDMPERYFQVSREESHDGCYYSKIKAIDWDEI